MKLSIYSALFAAALACPSGYAQTTKHIAAIPFDFRVGDRLLPAGTYNLHETSYLLTMQNAKGKGAACHLISPASRSEVSAGDKLQFHRIGGEYYLTNLWVSGSRQGKALGLSKRARQIARQTTVAESTKVPMLQASR